MKFLLNLFKKEEKKQRKLQHRQPQEISEEQFRIALSFARREMSLGDVADRLNLTNRNLSYIFITNAFRQLIDKGILIESNGVTKNELDVCDLDDNKPLPKRPVGRPRINLIPLEEAPKRQYTPRKRVLNGERFTTLMEQKGLQFENLSKNAQLKINKYYGIIDRLKFMPDDKLKAINAMTKRANELEKSIFKSVFYFTPEKYQRKLDYLKKCGFIKDKSNSVGLELPIKKKKGQVAVWKPEAVNVLGSKKITKYPTKFMRRKYPNLIDYVNA